MIKKKNLIRFMRQREQKHAECVLIDYYKGEAKDRIHQIHHKSKELLLRYELIKMHLRNILQKDIMLVFHYS